jgi:hypothetical protein
MEWAEFCESMALECELRSAGLEGPHREEWLDMAADWRAAALHPEPPGARDLPPNNGTGRLAS